MSRNDNGEGIWETNREIYEILTKVDKYAASGILQTWWDDKLNCNIVLYGYNLFKRNKFKRIFFAVDKKRNRLCKNLTN